MGGAHDVGSGENAHLWADELRRAVDLEDDTGRPLVLEVAEPLHPANQRLMDTLGVEVRQVTTVVHETITCPVATCGWTWVGLPSKAQPFVDAHLKLMHASLGNARREPAPTERNVMPEVVCKVEGCDRDASDAPKAGSHARLCAVHRAERSREMSDARRGKPRGAKTTSDTQKTARSRTAERTPEAVRDRSTVNGNGSHASKAERLLAAARAVDEIEAQLEQARAELKEAAAALA